MKRKISPTRSTGVKKQRTNKFNTLRHINERVKAAIPNQQHTFMNIMQQYIEQLPKQDKVRLLYKYNQPKFAMPTRMTMNTMQEIERTKGGLRKRLKGPGSRKNNPILLVSL